MQIILTICILAWLYASAKVIIERKEGGDSKYPKLYTFGVVESSTLKVILALGIVLAHLQTFCLKPHDYPIVNQFATLAQAGVFFFISGYGLVAAYLQKGQDYLHNFLRHRLGKIVLPLLIVTGAYLLEKQVFLTETGGVKSDTLLPFSWFCYVIIIYYLAYFFSLKTTTSLGSTIIILLILTIVFYPIGKCLHLGDWWYRSTWGFNLGMIVKYYEPLIKTILSRFIASVMLFVPFGLFCIYAAGYFHVDMEVQTIGLSMLALLFVYVTGFKSSKHLAWLGKYSYGIYLCHPLVIAIYPLWPMTGIMGDFTYTIFLLASTIALAVLLNTIMKLKIIKKCL